MKKEILKAFLIIAVVAAGSSAFGSAAITSAGTSLGTQTFKTSNAVTLDVASSSSSWAATDSHASGDRAFGASFNDTKIYWTTGTTLTGPTDTSAYTSWVSL